MKPRVVRLRPRPRAPLLMALSCWLALASDARPDGMVVAPRDYRGSLEERAQEAIILFRAGDATHEASEDLILKIRVEGDVERFAWVVPLPVEPVSAPEDARLFEELHQYVQARLAARFSATKGEMRPGSAAPAPGAVEVLSRRDVGSYDVAVVRERQAGTLNSWLAENGFQPPRDADDVIDAYRKKGYVFACVKVSEAGRGKGRDVDLHPLRFTFATGGRDGIYFPMRMTGLQSGPFDVNLYVFYNKWINDRLSRFGYVHRGFTLNWRDYDSPECEPNAGKRWSDPSAEPYLKPHAQEFPTFTGLVRKLHPGERYYLTNIRASGLVPAEVRRWSDDLWLFPYYTDPRMVPFDAREGGPAAGASPDPRGVLREPRRLPPTLRGSRRGSILAVAAAGGAAVLWLAGRWRGKPIRKPDELRD